MDSITDLLDLEDPNIYVSDTRIDGNTKTLVLASHPVATFCPLCGYRMYSRGTKIRKITHPILQDGYKLKIELKQRRWQCTNDACKYNTEETFKFVDKGRRNTNATDMLIVQAFRDLDQSSTRIAERFHTSDTHVLEIFDKYVRLDRLPLTDIISVDEVYTEIEPSCAYSLIIQDFYTGDTIDILRSRKANVTEPYFANLPKEEREAVKYLISDMYSPYIDYVNKYFPNAVSVVDSFHVIQWMIHSIDNYLRSLRKKYKTRDRELYLSSHPYEQLYPEKPRIPLSDEVYLLQKFRWLILSNQSSITYHADPRWDRHFKRMMNSYDYEDLLFHMDSRLQRLRELKECYIDFNTRNAGSPISAATEIDKLITTYRNSSDSIFIEFANTLNRYKPYIINSFVMVEKYGAGKLIDARLSNGPIESLNRKIKDLKRLGRGFKNFEHFRNRFLYATRNNPVLNGSYSSIQVHYYDEDD